MASRATRWVIGSGLAIILVLVVASIGQAGTAPAEPGLTDDEATLADPSERPSLLPGPLASTQAEQTSTGGTGSTLLVDDDGEDCPEASFATIKDAVDAAEAGDTVRVCAGVYHEEIRVTTTSLTLVADGQAVLDGQGELGFGLWLTSDGITVDGLTIRDYTLYGIHVESFQTVRDTTLRNVTIEGVHGSDDRSAGVLAEDVRGMVVEDSRFLDNENGIVLVFGQQAEILKNTVTESDRFGVVIVGHWAGSAPPAERILEDLIACLTTSPAERMSKALGEIGDDETTAEDLPDVDDEVLADVTNPCPGDGDPTDRPELDNTIEGNHVKGGATGIVVEQSGGDAVLGNAVENTTEPAITLFDSGNAYLRNNTMVGNGLYVQEAYRHDIDRSNTVDGKPVIYLVDAADLTIDGDESEYAEIGYLGVVDSPGVDVRDLEVSGSGQGILLAGVQGASITNATLTDNFVGLFLDDASVEAVDNRLEDNANGLLLVDGDLPSRIVSNTLAGNGFGIQGVDFPPGTVIADNRVVNSTFAGISVFLFGSTVDQHLDQVREETGLAADEEKRIIARNTIENVTCPTDGWPFGCGMWGTGGLFVMGMGGGAGGLDIVENTVTNTTKGIWRAAWNSPPTDTLLKDNTVTDHTAWKGNDAGIFMQLARGNTLDGNLVKDDKMGIVLVSWGTTLRDNHMVNNTWNFHIGHNHKQPHSIDRSNTADGDPIVYLHGASDTSVKESDGAGYVACVDCDNVTIRDLELSNNLENIHLAQSSNVLVENVSLAQAFRSLTIYDSENITVQDSNVSADVPTGSPTAIYASGTDGLVVADNGLEEFWTGVDLRSMDDFKVTGNVFENPSVETPVYPRGPPEGIHVASASGEGLIADNEFHRITTGIFHRSVDGQVRVEANHFVENVNGTVVFPNLEGLVEIDDNVFEGNTRAGVAIATEPTERFFGAVMGADTQVEIYGNSFLDNAHGVLNPLEADEADGWFPNATGNWWGASDGPSSPNASNPLEDPVTGALADGAGDGITGYEDGTANVRFDPWLTEAPE